MIHDPFHLAGYKSASADKSVEDVQIQSNPQSAVTSSESKVRLSGLLYGVTTVAILIATISVANYLVVQRSSYDVMANVENTHLVYGMIGSVNAKMNSFSLLFERSNDPAISESGKVRFTIVLPSDDEISLESSNTKLPICFSVNSLTDLTLGKAVSCSSVIQTGNKVAVSYSSYLSDQSLLMANLVIIEIIK